LLKQLDQTAMALMYGLAMRVRSVVWRIQRPKLIGVRALIVRDQSVLLIRHRAGRQPWALPGGGVERGESLAEAARREAREETGAHVEIVALQGVYDRFKGGTSNYIGVFICAPLSEPNPPRSLEIAEARYFAFDALPAGIDEGSRQRIAEYMRGERGLAREW
jgi:ADP-ribose pyrophosphatase YjhB (NUDIX family)